MSKTWRPELCMEYFLLPENRLGAELMQPEIFAPRTGKNYLFIKLDLNLIYET
jgi:hypothetical protein